MAAVGGMVSGPLEPQAARNRAAAESSMYRMVQNPKDWMLAEMIEESQFKAQAEATLEKIESALDEAAPDFDYEMQPGGILELEFDNGSKIIINRHTAAREIWVAAKSGGFHFRPEGGKWVNTRTGEELFAALSRRIGEQGGEEVRFG